MWLDLIFLNSTGYGFLLCLISVHFCWGFSCFKVCFQMGIFLKQQIFKANMIFFLTWTCNCCVASLCSLVETYTISPTSFWSRVCASSCSGTWANTTSLRTTTPGWPLSPTTIHCDTIKYNIKNENQNYLIIKTFKFKKGVVELTTIREQGAVYWNDIM